MLIIVKNIFLCSLREKVGKSLLSIGIIQKLQKEGRKVAYFKPIGIPKTAFSNKADLDVGFMMNNVLKSMKYDIISPISIPNEYYIDLINADKDGIKKFGNGYKKYMQKVPRANFLLDIIRLLRSIKKK